MDNYLSPRWPRGAGVQPPPVPDPAAPQRPAPQRPRRSRRRWLVSAVCVVLCLALLGGISFWAVNGLAGLLAGVQIPDSFGDPPPHRSWQLPSAPSRWSPDDLPWGDPDPAVQLTVEPLSGPALSGREVHETVLPSIVYIEATAEGSLGAFSGTGVVVTGSGYVLTNYHIVEETDYVEVMLLNDRARSLYPAKVIGFDEKFDVAVLKFDGEGLDLTPASLGDSDQLAVGDPVYAVGNPLGYLTGTMTEGIVSALEREDEVDSRGLGMIQTSAALNPGNSGGALVNQQGQVVGITSAKITGLMREDNEDLEDAAVLENIGLALPISDILPFVNRILATGKSWRPSIGVTCFESAVDGRTGIQVKEVERDVPARSAGLRPGDLIVSANGRPVSTLTELRRAIYRAGMDEEFHCVVVRDGAEIPISFPLVDKLDEQ